MMWKWIKRFIYKLITTDERMLLMKNMKSDYSKMTKGDLKKLLAQGKIKDYLHIQMQIIYRFVMSLKMVLINALEDRYNARISEADATIKIYLTNSVGIGEHPQHLDEIDKQLAIITDSEEKFQLFKHLKYDRRRQQRIRNSKRSLSDLRR